MEKVLVKEMVLEKVLVMVLEKVLVQVLEKVLVLDKVE